MIKRPIFVLGIILITLFICTFVSAQAFENSVNIEKVKKNLIEDGVDVSKISIENSSVQITMISNGLDKANPEDIMSIRKIKNELRKPEYTDKIKNLNLVIANKNGDVIFNRTYNDITTIPNFNEDLNVFNCALTDEEIKEKVHSILSEKDHLKVEKIEIKSVASNGKKVSLACAFTDTDVSKVNGSVREIMYDIKTMNTENNAGICQYDLYIYNASNEPLVVLSNDLVYRDISWWQSPLLGNESWRGSGPEVK